MPAAAVSPLPVPAVPPAAGDLFPFNAVPTPLLASLTGITPGNVLSIEASCLIIANFAPADGGVFQGDIAISFVAAPAFPADYQKIVNTFRQCQQWGSLAAALPGSAYTWVLSWKTALVVPALATRCTVGMRYSGVAGGGGFTFVAGLSADISVTEYRAAAYPVLPPQTLGAL